MLRNLECDSIGGVFILDEGSDNLAIGHPRLTIQRVRARPTYADFFAWINDISGDDDVSIVANADIWFDRQLELFNRWSLPTNVALALSRWKISDSDGAKFYPRNDSQDSWVFRGHVRPVRSDYAVGVPRCDNRLVSELRNAGYEVLNPSYSLRSFHVHSASRGTYGTGFRPGYVSPPYGYVWPTNLWSRQRTAEYNARYPNEKLGWQPAWRKWSAHLRRKRAISYPG
jgi:hypothetical protein